MGKLLRVKFFLRKKIKQKFLNPDFLIGKPSGANCNLVYYGIRGTTPWTPPPPPSGTARHTAAKAVYAPTPPGRTPPDPTENRPLKSTV